MRRSTWKQICFRNWPQVKRYSGFISSKWTKYECMYVCVCIYLRICLFIIYPSRVMNFWYFSRVTGKSGRVNFFQWWFNGSSSQVRAILPSRGHLAMCQYILVVKLGSLCWRLVGGGRRRPYITYNAQNNLAPSPHLQII